MKIVADENIPFVKQAFAHVGKVHTCSGREMNADIVKDADILLVRSITKVNASLLDGSAVRFVATATIGMDHIDQPYLAERGIDFSSAPGSNAESVAQYVTAALLVLARKHDFSLSDKSIGIVGVGNVGIRVERNCRALGMKVLLNDPPLQRHSGDEKYLPIDDLFEADIITMHVPLSKQGEDATFHLGGNQFLGRMKPGSILINTSRGAVVDNAALLESLKRGHLAAAVLDVWEGEPEVNAELLEKVDIGTSHIAGYSYDGKVCGTEMIYHAACKCFGIEPQWKPLDDMPVAEVQELRLNTEGLSKEEILLKAVSAIYDIEKDDAGLRAVLEVPKSERGAFFDRLRKQYPRRREFHNTTVVLEPFDESFAKALRGIRFQV